MAIEFRYKEEKSRLTKTVLRPVADAALLAKSGEWIEFHPYIDSGADITLIPLSFGKLLGLEVEREKLQELRGISEGAIPVIMCNLRLKIGPHEMDARVAWALIEEAVPLLGRLDVFDRFRITFDESEGKIAFEWKG